MNRTFIPAFALLCSLPCVATRAGIVTFFDGSQAVANVASGVTSDTISCNGYLFTYTRDKLFTGGAGHTEPVGRNLRVLWPDGLEAQAVTAGSNPGGARLTISRVDGDLFDIKSFSAKLLAMTAETGGAIEIMPKLNGEDALNDPFLFNATGFYGNVFSYNESTQFLGTTTRLKGFESYTLGLFVDFALTQVAIEGAAVPEPAGLAMAGLAIGMLAFRPRRSARGEKSAGRRTSPNQ